MSISQNFPDISPSLNLNFAGARKLDSRITFTRGSTGTYMDQNGLIKTAGINQARFDHSYDGSDIESLGLLIEEQRTNLLLQSNSFTTTWAATGTTGFSQNIISPTGVSNSGWTINDQSSAGDADFFDQQISITPSTTTNYCLSIFAKQGTATYFDFYAFFIGNSTKGSYLTYNFSTNTLSVSSADGGGITPTIYGKIDYPNGWVRLYFVVNDANNGLNNTILYRIYPGSRNPGITGTTLFYGAQVEIGNFPTSYIPTSGSTVTRSADNASITGTNFSNWYNQSEGTLFANLRTLGYTSGTFPRPFGFVEFADQFNDFWQIVYNGSAQTVFTETRVNAGGKNSVTNQSLTPNTNIKIANAVKNGEGQFISYNGQSIVSNVSSSLSSAINSIIFNYSNHNGIISQLFYYPKRLTNTQLQELTK